MSKKAKNDNWLKGVATAKVEAASDIQSFKATLTQPQLHIFNEEVIQRTAFAKTLSEFSQQAMAKAEELIKETSSGIEFKAIVEGVDKHSITVGFNDRHAATSDVNVNNTNAQQTIVKRDFNGFYED